MPNLVAITCPSLQILGKTQTGVFPDFWSILKIVIVPEPVMIIDIKLGPVTKLDKRNKITSKN